jgi:hypothetical protein
MTKTGQNFTMYARTRMLVRVVVTDSVTGDPDDLTEYASLKWTLSPFEPNSTSAFRRVAVLEKSSLVAQASTGGNQIDVTGTDDNQADIQLIGADTEDLEGSYYHELEGFDASGNGVVLATGTATILGNVVNS